MRQGVHPRGVDGPFGRLGRRVPGSLPDQNIDITGLDPGTYRLRVTADDGSWFAESNEENNFTWVDRVIKTKDNRACSATARPPDRRQRALQDHHHMRRGEVK